MRKRAWSNGTSAGPLVLAAPYQFKNCPRLPGFTLQFAEEGPASPGVRAELRSNGHLFGPRVRSESVTRSRSWLVERSYRATLERLMSRNGPVTSRVCTLLVLLLSASIGVASCGRRERSRVWETRESGSLGEQPIEPLPLTAEFDVAHAALGEILFAERMLSGDGKVACTDCHRENHGWADD